MLQSRGAALSQKSLGAGSPAGLSLLTWRLLHSGSRRTLLVTHNSFQVFAVFWLPHCASEPVCFLGYAKIPAWEAIVSIACVWWTLPAWDENRVAHSSSCGCSHVSGVACRMCRGYGMAGGMIEAVCACCQLPPLLMPGLSVLLVRVSLSPMPVMTGSAVTDGGRSRGVPAPSALAQRERREDCC